MFRYFLLLLETLLLVPISVGQDPGQIVGQYQPALALEDGRFGWQVPHFRGLGLLEEHVSAMLAFGEVAHMASSDLVAAAMDACVDYKALYYHCDIRHFNASVATIRQKADHSLKGLGSQLEWIALPSAWQIFPTSEYPNQFASLIIVGRRALNKLLIVAASLHGDAKDLVNGIWFIQIIHLVQKFTKALMIIADRFVAAATLFFFATKLEEELPGSSEQPIVFDDSLGAHHVQIISALLGASTPTESSDVYMAELGTFEGQTPDFLLKRHPHLHVITVDPFDFVLKRFGEYVDDAAARRDRVHNLLRKFGTRVTILPTTSQEASSFIANDFFQLVFVDGGPRDQEVRSWRRKVRPAGFLVGHDFKLGMEFDYILEIFRTVPRNETLYLAPDWIWFLRWWPQ